MEKIYELFTEDKKIITDYGIQLRTHIKSPSRPTTIHHHNYYELFFLPEAGLIHQINDQRIDLPKGSLVFVRPQDYHEFFNYSQRDKNSIIYFISSKPEIVESIFEVLKPQIDTDQLLSAPLSPYTVLSNIERNSLESKMKFVNSINSNSEDEVCLYLKKLLMSIFCDYFRAEKSQTKPPADIPLWLLNTIESMKQVENFSKGIPQMVQLSEKTIEHLSRSMKKFYNTTPSNFVNDLRLNYVANLMVNSDLSVADACFESGFQNISWMNVKFKEKFGITPTQYRDKK